MFATSAKGFIFDLDGTLVDSAPDLIGACNRVLRELGRDQVPLSVGRGWIGNGARRLMERALIGSFEGVAPADLLDQAFSMFLKFYREGLCVDSRLYPSVKETLTRLVGQDKRLACVTNKPSAFTRPLLELLDLDGFFDPIVSGDDLPKKKPDPMPLQHVLNTWGMNPEDCLMVGDSVSDCGAARVCGMPVVLVNYGYSQGMNLESLAPGAMIDSIDQIVTFGA
jgi:phosphoglycolate phosphatase